ncbi:phytanoyl-CoA dioxygenase family protein [Rhodopila sp.]|uniref:phytanoyl-CoA dioxygenase family protein n=1 Tax=Rhodopila sp. TaxID=2480087 RepID=UPI003D14680C
MERPLDSETVDKFHGDGFVAMEQLVSPQEAERMRAVLLRLHETRVGFNEGAQFDAAGCDTADNRPRFPQILNPSNYAKELLTTSYRNTATAIAKQLLGQDARLQLDIAFFKPARIGSDTPWHQDEAFSNPDLEHDQITIWLALAPISRNNSCMSFIPGSHKLPVLEHRAKDGDPRNHALECIGTFDAATAVECPLQAGGATIHSHRTLHYAGPNPSSEYRIGYALVFDTPFRLRKKPLVFGWQQHQQLTDRQLRKRAWRRHGGIIVELWRGRQLARNHLAAKLPRIFHKLRGNTKQDFTG